jgi:hypothetical protein
MMEWVKCSERMPNDFDFVFVFDANSGRYSYVFFDGECWGDGEFYSGVFAGQYTHWMKPEAPKE